MKWLLISHLNTVPLPHPISDKQILNYFPLSRLMFSSIQAILTSSCVLLPLSSENKHCPGLGLFYGMLATVFFSIIALLVKTIDGVHAVEISAIRCFFQMLFVMPMLIYYK